MAEPFKIKVSVKEVIKGKGFALVSCGHGINGAQSYIFMHRRTGEYIGVQEQQLDEEESWDVLGVTEQEIKHRMEERNKTECPYTTEEINSKIGDWGDEDYKKVILEIIEEKAKEHGNNE